MHSSNHSNTKTNVKIIAVFRTRTIELRETSCFLNIVIKEHQKADLVSFLKVKSFHIFPHIHTLAILIVKGYTRVYLITMLEQLFEHL